MWPLHMMSQVIGVHFSPTLLSNYPGSIPFLKGGSLTRSYPLVRLNSLIPPNEPRRAYHCLGITQVFFSPTLSNIITWPSVLSAPRLDIALISVHHLCKIIWCDLPPPIRTHDEPPGVHRPPRGPPRTLHPLQY